MARQHLLFHTTNDLLNFCQLYPHWKDKPGQNVFTALGLSPSSSQLQELIIRFPNARLVGVFDNDIVGNVLDCKIVLWQRSKNIQFRLIQNDVTFRFKGIDFKIPAGEFSLHRFKTLTGIRSTYRTIKPKQYVSFLAMSSHTMGSL
ncbi:hypothetical protein [Sphingobacterium sp. CZ-UAM]|uniref:hypothetical protein n=1 Tax=Sphingobacterium sp. CZ-UAM TaxID=1933868 RepID=UPI0011159001|nr:hypothetical protein [Sphingobacterium sp. CZ-UAM]